MGKKNDTANVSVGKGVAGGYAFSAPITATVPNDYKTPLAEEFVNLGYITEDGIEFALDADTEDFNDMNGDVYETVDGTQTETVVLTLAETMKDSLSEAFGHSNVSDEDGTLTVKHNSTEHEERIYVFELLLKNGRKWRAVVPHGKASRTSSTTVSKSGIVGYQITIKCLPDGDGNRIIDYIEDTKADAASYALMSKDALVAEATGLGIDVTKKDTKEEIIDKLTNGGIL